MSPHLQLAGRSLLWGILFGLAYSQAPLYTSNQNQYFLHGLAKAGVGFLAEDWLANTADPTPLFSGLVTLTARLLHPAAFYGHFMLLAALYFLCLRRLAGRLFDLGATPGAETAFAGLMFVSHSALLRVILGRGIGGEWEYLFDGGVAGQRLLGDVLQPSAFGVFLLVSVQQHLENRRAWAAAAAALAATVHPTYLLPAGLLTAAYLLDEFLRRRQLAAPLRLGGLALGLVLPMLIYLGRTFLPASAEAQRILVEFRLPAHAVPSVWLNLTTVVKLAWIGLALYVLRRTRLAGVMAVALGTGLGLTLIQIATRSDALALAFPWRVSTVLVPLATAVLAAAAARWIARRIQGPALRVTVTLLVGLTVASGMLATWAQSVQRAAAAERPVLEYVKSSNLPGQVYLIPPRLQDFRLFTGSAAFADFKSIPYRGEQVLDWYQRIRLLDFFYRDVVAEIDCELLDEFEGTYGVTHVIVDPDQRQLTCPGLRRVYDDGQYSVFRLERED
jgi:hypothetical protein